MKLARKIFVVVILIVSVHSHFAFNLTQVHASNSEDKLSIEASMNQSTLAFELADEVWLVQGYAGEIYQGFLPRVSVEYDHLNDTAKGFYQGNLIQKAHSPFRVYMLQ